MKGGWFLLIEFSDVILYGSELVCSLNLLYESQKPRDSFCTGTRFEESLQTSDLFPVFAVTAVSFHHRAEFLSSSTAFPRES